MKVAILVLLVVALVAAQRPTPGPRPTPKPEQGTITISQYTDPSCATFKQNFSLNMNQCYPGDGSHNVTSLDMDCVGSQGTCVVLGINASSTCQSPKMSMPQPCDMCHMSQEKGVGFHKFSCNLRSKNVTVSFDCDEQCQTCNKTQNVAVGQCVSYDNNQQFVQIESVTKCPEMVMERMFAAKNCTGNGHFAPVPTGQCLNGTIFTCNNKQSRPHFFRGF